METTARRRGRGCAYKPRSAGTATSQAEAWSTSPSKLPEGASAAPWFQTSDPQNWEDTFVMPEPAPAICGPVSPPPEPYTRPSPRDGLRPGRRRLVRQDRPGGSVSKRRSVRKPAGQPPLHLGGGARGVTGQRGRSRQNSPCTLSQASGEP